MVLLFGSFGGWLNWGDIIQLKSWLDFYQNLDYQIFVLLNKDALNQDKDIFLLYQKLFPGVNFVFYSSKDKTFEDISGVSDFSQNPIEIFHVYGGGFLNAFWGKTNLEIIEEALFFFRPEYYFITGQQISKEFISYAGEHFSVFKPHILGVRDKLTEAWLKEIGLNPVFTFDDSFEYLKNLSQKFFNKESIFSPVGEAIGIHLNLSYYTLSNSESLTKVKAELELLGKYVKEKDLKVYLLKGYQSYTSQVKDTTKAIDYFFLSRFFPYYEVIDIIGIELNNDWKKFHEIFSKVKFRSFFSSSYHLSLFFQFLGVPSYLFNFNSYYFQKKREIVGEEISLENFLENFEKIRESQIRNLEKNLKVRENLRDIIIKKLDKKELNKENEREKAFMKTYHKILEEFKVENQVEIDKWTDWWMKRAIYEEREKVKLFEEKEDLRKTLERINKKLEEVNKEKEDLRKTLERIYNSRGWKVLSFYYKLKWYFLHTLGLLDRKKNQITEERVEKFNEVESSEFILEIEKKLDGELKGFKILMVTPDIMGPIKSGGIGTAFYELSKLLVEEGAEVTILYALGDYSEEGTIDKWIEFYNKHGIKFIPLKIEEFLYIGTPYFRQIAHKVDLWLKEREKEFDMVIFPEWMGLAYYVLLAKRQNLRYQNLSIIVNTHSPEIWAYEGNYWLPYDVNMVDRDFMERKCVELADYVISPSQYLLNWMKDRKWAIPKNSFVIQNYIDKRLFKNFPKINENSWGRIEKLIFFGRPEPRKGLFIFIKALQLLSEDKRKLIKEIIFLGKPINTENFDSIKYLKEAEESVKIPFKVLSFSRNKSLEFLINQRNSLVVIPSLIENLPYTVLEALNLGIPFIASKVGGIPELIAEEYKDEVLFDPIPAELAKKLENLIGKESKIFKPAKDSDEIKKEWIKFFKSLQSEKNKLKSELIKIKEYPLISVCLVHYERPEFLKEALESLYKQTYRKFEIILVDDGSRSKEAIEYLNYLEEEFKKKGFKLIRGENKYLGSARNRAAKEAKGELLLFMDDDNIAKPEMLEIFTRAYLKSGADVYTCFNIIFEDGEEPEKSKKIWLPLGGSLGSGLFINAFGDANALINKKVFENIGGFTEDYGIGFEDWELFTKIVLAGYRLEVIPEPLYYYRVRKDSMLRNVDRFKSEFRRIRPLLYFDEKGLGIGIGYALKLYLDWINKEKEISNNVMVEDLRNNEYYKAKEVFKKYWQKNWFRKMTKVILKFLR